MVAVAVAIVCAAAHTGPVAAADPGEFRITHIIRAVPNLAGLGAQVSFVVEAPAADQTGAANMEVPG